MVGTTTRFVPPNLAALGDLPLVDSLYDDLEARRVEFYIAALAAHGIEYDVQNLETDPHRITFSEGGAAVEQLLDERINNAIRFLSLATARDPGLRHIGATYYGVSQQQTTDENGDVVLEETERFRSRIQLAPEAFSTAGPEGAYLFHALELDGVQDVAHAGVLGHEDDATYTDGLHADAYSMGRKPTPFTNRNTGDPVLPSEVLIVALPSVEYGVADQALLDRVWKALHAADVRPLADAVRVEEPEVIDYEIDIEVVYSRGAAPDPLIAEIEKNAKAYADARRFVGGVAQRLGIASGAFPSNSEFVAVNSPAADVGGGLKQVPNCTGITVTAVQDGC